MNKKFKIGDYEIPRESLKERFLRYAVDSRISLFQLAKMARLGGTFPYNLVSDGSMRFGSLEKIANHLDLISLVLYNEERHCVEDLESSGFLSGENIENYVGRVFRRRRMPKGLTQKKISKMSHLSSSYLSQVENGLRDIGTGNIDMIGDLLDLIPFYLVPKSKTIAISQNAKY